MAKSRSFGTEKTRGSAGDRKGPVGDMILDVYEDVERGFKAIEAEVDAISDGTSEFDVINEKTADAGVTVDGCLIKDGNVDGIDVSAISLSSMPAAASGNVDLGQQDVIGAKGITNHASEHITINSTNHILLQNSGVTRIQANATGLGFYAATPVAQPSDLSGTDFDDQTGGTPSATNQLVQMAAQADADNNFATLARAVNEIRDALRALGLMQ